MTPGGLPAIGMDPRPTIWNVGVALRWGGLAIGIPAVAGAGGAMLFAAVIGSIILLAHALARITPRQR